jgi:hypothetical protein
MLKIPTSPKLASTLTQRLPANNLIRRDAKVYAVVRDREALRPMPAHIDDRSSRKDVVVVGVGELPIAVRRTIRIEGNPVSERLLRAASGCVIDSGRLTFAMHAAADRHEAMGRLPPSPLSGLLN